MSIPTRGLVVLPGKTGAVSRAPYSPSRLLLWGGLVKPSVVSASSSTSTAASTARSAGADAAYR